NTPPSAPSPMSPVELARVDEGAPVTLTVENSVDPDGDPLLYEFRLSPSSLFEGTRVITSGEVEEGEGTTSWTTAESLTPGRWYWEGTVTDGMATTTPRDAQLVVGTGTYPDGGMVGLPDGGLIPEIDAGITPPAGGCSVAEAPSRGAAIAWMLGLALALVVWR